MGDTPRLVKKALSLCARELSEEQRPSHRCNSLFVSTQILCSRPFEVQKIREPWSQDFVFSSEEGMVGKENALKRKDVRMERM